MNHSLESFGLNDRVRALLAEHAEAGLSAGRVVRADRGSVLLATDDGIERAEPSARFLREAASAAELPAVGDWVGWRRPPAHDTILIETVLPRSSAFTRGDPGKATAGQVLAANIDTVFVVAPIAEGPNLRRIERELALSWESGAVPVVVLSKADLSDDPAAAHADVEEVALGVDVLVTSAAEGEGVDALRAYTGAGRTVALIGPSGAGKSTLINALLGEERQATNDVRATDGRGRHTTVARELVVLPGGGVLVDTPGLRALGLNDTDEGIAAAFADIESLAVDCRFADCAHLGEPGCAVEAAVESGDLDAARLESYHKLRREAAWVASKYDARLRAEQERRWKNIHKMAREHFRYKYGGPQ